MDKRIRNILIFIFVVLFFLAGPVVIFYSRGYRFDFETRKIVKTGAFVFKAQPKRSEIYLNGKLTKRTSFLSDEAFIKNLLPKKYNIKIEKEGYFPWEKTLEIKEELVTEAKNIVLFPKELDFLVSLSNIGDYFFSPDEEKIILKKFNKKDWSLEIFDLEKNTQENFLQEKELGKKEFQFLGLNWGPNSKEVLIKTKGEEKIQYFITNISKNDEGQIFSLDYLGNIEEISFNPQNSQEIFFIKNLKNSKSLLKTNYSKKEVPGSILDNLVTYKTYKSDIFWLSDDGFLYQSDFSGKRIGVLNVEPFSIKKGLEYKIEVFSTEAIFLREENTFYQLNLSSRIFKKVSGNIKYLKFSPDSKKLCLANDYEIWILFLEDIFEQPQRKAGQNIFLTRFSKKIDQIFWLNSNYLVFNTGNKIKIVEIDDRDRINIIDLKEFEEVDGEYPKIFWNQTNQKLYTLSGENLYILENLF